MTATANTAFTAANFNQHVRDNLLETAPGKATGGVTNGSYPVKSATNQITFRTPQQVEVTASQSTSSSSYTNLSTSGPSVTVVHGPMVYVTWHASISNNSINSSYMGIQLSGSNTFSATDDLALRHRDPTGSNGENMMSMNYLFTGLTPGTTTFQAKYRSLGGTATFRYRRVCVFPL